MIEAKAKQVLTKELEIYRSKSYEELAELIGSPIAYEKAGANGSSYQIEIQVLWDARPNEDIRVIGSIDDGGWRAFFPITDSFIKRFD